MRRDMKPSFPCVPMSAESWAGKKGDKLWGRKIG
jgi:hypothetical protein